MKLKENSQMFPTVVVSQFNLYRFLFPVFLHLSKPNIFVQQPTKHISLSYKHTKA